MPEYFIILLLFLALTTGLYVCFRPRIYTSTKQMIAMNIFICAVAITWDQFAIYRGHWKFGEQFLLGPKLGLMPIEELGFTIIIWHLCIVMYKIIENHIKKSRQ